LVRYARRVALFFLPRASPHCAQLRREPMNALGRLQAGGNFVRTRGRPTRALAARLTDAWEKDEPGSGDVELVIQDIKNPQLVMSQLDGDPDLYALA
jgi:hypothetical protein